MISLYVGSSRRGLTEVQHPNSLANSHMPTHPILLETINQDEDSESGKGPSLPMSPHSVDGAIGGPAAKPFNLMPELSSEDDEGNSGLGKIGGHHK